MFLYTKDKISVWKRTSPEISMACFRRDWIFNNVIDKSVLLHVNPRSGIKGQPKKKKKTFIDCKIMVCSKTPFSKSSHHIHHSQLICNSNQLTGLYMIQVFTEDVLQQTISCPEFFPVSFFTRYRQLHCIQKYQRCSSLGLKYSYHPANDININLVFYF